MVNKRLIITISFLFTCHLIFSQKESNIWYFGANAGIDFYNGKPVAITNSNMYTTEGSVSHSTYNGRLLFYTDGSTIWDSTHTIMPNGKDLAGSSASTQSVAIVPKPFNFKRYYIFTADNVGGSDGICYSELDMTRNKGKGDIISLTKNKKLVTPACEKITSIKHANGIDYWILVHKFNSDLIYAYRVTGYGVISRPVISKTGINISGDYSNTLGYMKFSPDGRKLAYANFAMDSSVIADFDANTGKVNNVWTFPNKDTYGIEFSAKSRYLYVGEFISKRIFQYDAKAPSVADFLASRTLIDSNYSNDLGALQLGPDGRLYISVTGSKYLQVIHYPDSAGIKCHSQKDFLYLGGRTCLLGLPNFSPYIFNKKTFTTQRNCLNDSTFFNISNINDIDSVVWNFGDPLSGANNWSKKIINVSHTYKKTGYYKVYLLYYYKKAFEWAIYSFYVRNPKPYIGKDTGFCNSFAYKIGPQRDYSSYKWQTGEVAKYITVNKKGSYILRTTDSGGCSSIDTILIVNPKVKADFLRSDTALCAKNNVFSFDDNSNYDDDYYKSCKWEFGDGTNLTGKNVKKEYPAAGTYKIKLTVESINHCSSTAEKYVNVIPNPIAAFTNTDPCFPESVKFTNQSSISKGKIIAYIWDLGDKTSSNDINPLKYYEEPNKYNVKLSVISDKGCTDSITKHRGIWVKQKPKAVFNFSEVSSMNNGKRVVQFNNLSTMDVVTNKWDFGKGKTSSEKNPALNYIDSGENKFTLMVTNDLGCKDTFSIITYNKFYFNLPNAFSPDANNVNETFGPVSSLFVNTYTMEIFDRWGEKLFESYDISEGWDGNYLGKPCADGIYICKISLTPYNNVLQHYETSFRLFR